MAMTIAKFQRPIGEVLKQKIAPYTMEVGILVDGPHKLAGRLNSKTKFGPGSNLKRFAGGAASGHPSLGLH